MSIETGCGRKEPQVQVHSALGDQERAVEKLVSLAEEVRARVDAVLTPAPPATLGEGDGRSPVSPLAEKINSINSRARYGQIVLQDILNRLEI